MADQPWVAHRASQDEALLQDRGGLLLLRICQVSVQGERRGRLVRYPCTETEKCMRRLRMPCPYCAAPTTIELSRTTTLGYRMFRCQRLPTNLQ